MRLGSALLVASFLLAGCADSNEGSKNDALREAEKAAAALEVEATSTTGVIRGVVVDEAIRPIAGVTITMASLAVSQTTNEQGAFGFEALEPGTYFLTASHPDYTQVQQAAEVVAGIDNPSPLRIQVQSIPRATPFIEALTNTIFIDGSFNIPGVVRFTSGGFTSDHGYWFEMAIAPNGTLAQTELVWSMTSPLAEDGRMDGGTYNGDDEVDEGTSIGPSPLLHRANATDKDGNTADSIYYELWSSPSGGLPIGVMHQQEVTAFMHIFHNFLPNEGWLFSRDGEHPIPAK